MFNMAFFSGFSWGIATMTYLGVAVCMIAIIATFNATFGGQVGFGITERNVPISMQGTIFVALLWPVLVVWMIIRTFLNACGLFLARL